MPSAHGPACPCGGGNRISKQLSKLEVRKIQETERQLKLQAAIQAARQKERAAFDGHAKRRSNDFLARYLDVPIESADTIRLESRYQARSYNRARQVLGLIDHLFVRYPVPLFLYRSMLSLEGLELVFGETHVFKAREKRVPPDRKYRHWFFAVARGESFAKASREVFTKREAHWFLQAPPMNPIAQNIFWARAAAAGVPLPGCDYLCERLDPTTRNRLGDRLPDLLRFYAEAWDQMRGHDRDEITDFVRAAVIDRTFSFKGRTFGSMRKLCHEWHQTVYAGRVRAYRTWMPRLPYWEVRKKGWLVRAVELTNNRALNDEGNKQRHCVFTYAEQCVQGRCAIVSLRWIAVGQSADDAGLEIERVTLEVNPDMRTVVQIRGKLNRRATPEEMAVIRQWAGEHGYVIHPFA